MSRSLKLLVVEDVQMAQIVAKMVLTELGHEVDIAKDGPEAVTMVEKNTYDFIFMDVGLPVFDGIEATQRIRRLEKDQSKTHVPIVALSANYEESNKKACIASGMNGFLSKPLTKEAAVSVLEQFTSSYEPSSVI